MKQFWIESYNNINVIQEQASVISMCDVLEHIPYPIDLLLSAHQTLLDNWILFISLPNIESQVWNMWDRNNVNPYRWEIEHYHNFSRTRLYELLDQCGFKPIKYWISERYRWCMEIIAKKKI